MTNLHVTIRITWAKLRQIQPPPPVAQNQFETTDTATFEKVVEWEGARPIAGDTYVLTLGDAWTSEHTIDEVRHVEDANGKAQTIILLSDYADYGDRGRDDLVGAGFTQVDAD